VSIFCLTLGTNISAKIGFLFVFALLGFELRAYDLSHFTSPFFVKDFFKIGSHELFARVGFEP
jgi:hypothetical protein